FFVNATSNGPKCRRTSLATPGQASAVAPPADAGLTMMRGRVGISAQRGGSPAVREGVVVRVKDEGDAFKPSLHPSSFLLHPCPHALPDGRASAVDVLSASCFVSSARAERSCSPSSAIFDIQKSAISLYARTESRLS